MDYYSNKLHIFYFYTIILLKYNNSKLIRRIVF